MKRRKPECYLIHGASNSHITALSSGCAGRDVSETLLRLATMPSECELIDANATYNLQTNVTLIQQEERRHERNGKR